MKMTFEEACSAVADLFEADPDLWADEGTGFNAEWDMVGWESPDACHFCAVGGVLAAMGWGRGNALIRLDDAAVALGFNDEKQRPAANANDAGREVAIKMLRIAAGEITP